MDRHAYIIRNNIVYLKPTEIDAIAFPYVFASCCYFEKGLTM